MSFARWFMIISVITEIVAQHIEMVEKIDIINQKGNQWKN